jgi:hypothetical protein
MDCWRERGALFGPIGKVSSKREKRVLSRTTANRKVGKRLLGLGKRNVLLLCTIISLLSP